MTPHEPDAAIAFRRLTHDDLAVMERWLREDHVRRWWGDVDPASAALAAKYGPRIEGQTPVEPFVILCGGTPIGYIQLCLLRDFPEHAACIGAGDAAAGIDLFIGDPAYVYRGLGARVLRAFMDQVVFARDDVETCTVDPSPRNASAIRAYEKAGFVHLRTVRLPDETEPAYVMVRRRLLSPTRT